MQATFTKKRTTLWLCVTALFMALNVVMSSFGVPVPGGHLYMNDIIICTAAILLDPLAAFMVGGVGAFLGDLFFYPTPMFVSLATPRFAGNRDFHFLPLCAEKAPGTGIRHRRSHRCSHYGSGLFSGSCLHLQHPGICMAQAALSDSAGSSGRCSWHAALLEVRHPEAVQPWTVTKHHPLRRIMLREKQKTQKA